MNSVLHSDEDAQTAPGGRPKLDSLPNRQRLTTSQAAARTMIVRRLRIALPALAIALVAVLFFNTRSDGVDDAFLDDFADLEATPEELRMANPRFAGVDDEGYPYEITAETALQAPGVQEVVELIRPKAVTSGANESTTVIADKGVYRSEENILELRDSVTMRHLIGPDAYTFRTPAATVSIPDETVDAPGSVEGESESGTLRADSMRAYNNEGRVVFKGNVSMRIFPKKAGVGLAPAPESATPGEETPQ